MRAAGTPRSISRAIKRVHQCGALADADLVLVREAVQRVDVVPGAHHEAVVDRDRPVWRMRKHEPQAHGRRQAEFRHDRLEVVAVGAEAVQPDHAAVDVAARAAAGGLVAAVLELDRVGECCCHGLSVADAGDGRPSIRDRRRPRRGGRAAATAAPISGPVVYASLLILPPPQGHLLFR
jgi:hypothetical protein